MKTKKSRQINIERKARGLPPLNFRLFRKVIAKLETTPEAYDQSIWGRKESDAPCGTAACIAGWAAHLGGEWDLEKLRRTRGNGRRLGKAAAALLGIRGTEWQGDGPTESGVLFTATPYWDWPSPFSEQWGEARTDRQRARVAIRYLSRVISTGKVLE